MSTTETKVKAKDLPWKLIDGTHLGIADAFGVYLPIKVSNGGGTQRELMTRIVRAVNSHADMLEALEHAAEIIKVARNYFPKSISNRDRFDLENTNAAINKAIAKARGEVA